MNTLKKTAVVAGILMAGASAYAQTTIYSNQSFTSNPPTASNYGNQELGDQVTFGGTDRTLTSFSIDYFLGPAATGGTTPNGNETFQVFLRKMDGPLTVGGSIPSPGSVIYDSGVQPLSYVTDNGTPGYARIEATGLSLAVPESITWSVAFNGVESTELAGLLFANPPTVGASSDFFWKKNPTTGEWGVFNTSGVVDNFSATFTAVPEPGTLALLALGLGSLGFLGLRRKA